MSRTRWTLVPQTAGEPAHTLGDGAEEGGMEEWVFLREQKNSGGGVRVHRASTVDSKAHRRILARLCVLGGTARLEALKNNVVSMISNISKADSNEASDGKRASLEASTETTRYLLQLRPEDQFVVDGELFTIGTKEVMSERITNTAAARVQVTSSPPPEVHEDAGLRENLDHDDIESEQRPSHQPNLQVERSMTERGDLESGGSYPFIGQGGSRRGQQMQASTPGASLGGTDERILDTPALDTRHKDPVAQEVADSRLSSMLEPESREFASAREQISDGEEGKGPEGDEVEFDEAKVETNREAIPEPAQPRRRARRNVVESQESSDVLSGQSRRADNVLQNKSPNATPVPTKGSAGSQIRDGPDSMVAEELDTNPKQSPGTSEGSPISAPHVSEEPSQNKTKLPRKRKRGTVKGTTPGSGSEKRRKSSPAEDDNKASHSKEASPHEDNASPSQADKNTQWTFNADSSKEETPMPPPRRSKATKPNSRSPKDKQSHPSKIVFSNSSVPDQPKLIRFLKSHGVKVVDTVSANGSDLLVVGSHELKRTSKLTLSVALGKPVVTDAWVTDSHRAGHLLDTSTYLPQDAEHEAAWGFNLAAGIERGRNGNQILRGWTVRLTPSLAKDVGPAAVKELEHMACVGAGADAVITSRLPRDLPAAHPHTLVLAGTQADAHADADPDAVMLVNLGWEVYSKDILSLSILRGNLELDSEEFRVRPPTETVGRKKGR
ncbi:MAG: Myo-inositol-1-phosphate synthase [Chaenotheca gracillima]|nr:MAG: Myo-inositol-1-phosphate synthase [Chaenotheca gracillima]